MITTISRRATQLRDEAAYMVCGLWMIVGLYIDGWAHEADKPETFFTPWHGVLYSGFAAAVAYSAFIGRRDARAGGQPIVGDDRITIFGVVLFAIGAVGDFAWHSLVGIEVDLEGLVSPTHLALLIGGLFMVTLPIRSALQADEAGAPRPVLASAALAVAVTAFFLMYLMPWSNPFVFRVPFLEGSWQSDLNVQSGMAQVIVSTALLVGALLWLTQRWAIPFGTATVMFTAVAIGLAGLDGFEVTLPVLAATAAGLVADALTARHTARHVVGGATGIVLWAAFLGLFHLDRGVEWSPSLWMGAIVFAGLSGLATGVAVRER